MVFPYPKIPKTTCGAETIGSIDDLLFQILVHVPFKPLARLKLVSKHWNTIISEHHRRTVGHIFPSIPHEPRVIVSYISSNPLPQIHIPHSLRIIHSCNGLFVLKNTDTYAKHDNYYVHNPTTNPKTTPLLLDVITGTQVRVAGLYLAFDPSKSPRNYKVVCFWVSRCFPNNQLHQYRFDVYSSKTGSWKKRGGWWYTGDVVDFKNGVYWNGSIHWVGYYDGNPSIYFNPDHDVVPREMPAPPIRDRGRFYFGESCGHLHCAFFDGDDGIFVYEMRRDYSEWFLKYRVEDEECLQILGNGYNSVRKYLYSVVRCKRDEDSFLFLGTDLQGGEIVCYNLVHKTCQTMQAKDLCSANDVESFECIH